MTENWRKKMAISLTATFPEPSLGRVNSLPFSLTALAVIRSRRRRCCTWALLSATRSPEILFPWASVPLNVNTAIPSSSLYSPSASQTWVRELSNSFCLSNQPLQQLTLPAPWHSLETYADLRTPWQSFSFTAPAVVSSSASGCPPQQQVCWPPHRD